MSIKSRLFTGSLLARQRRPHEGHLVDEELSSEQRLALRQAVRRKIYGIAKPPGAAIRGPIRKGTRTVVSPLLEDIPDVSSTLATKPSQHLEVRRLKQGMKRCGPELVCLDQPGYVRLQEVLLIFPVSRAAWYEGVKRGVYPSPVSLGKRSVGYRTSDIRALLVSPTDYTRCLVPD